VNQLGVNLFHTNSAALLAEKILGNAGLFVKPIPAPRQLSSDCGIALRFDWEQHLLVEEELAKSRVETAGVRSVPC
jgi:hypothetical protein